MARKYPMPKKRRITELPVNGSNASRIQLYRFLKLSEECAEVGQAVSKIILKGPNNVNSEGLTTKEHLELEVADVLAAIDLLTISGDLDARKIAAYRAAKFSEQKAKTSDSSKSSTRTLFRQ